MTKYFGTDGIRGEVNKTLTTDIAYKVGRYIGSYYKGSKIVIGKDTRLSSSMFENMIASAASESGADVFLLGYCSTPSLAYIAEKEKFACGIMISASHNPYTDNGIKIFSNNGIKISDDLETKIEEYIDNPINIEKAYGDEVGNIYNASELLSEYKDWLYELYPIDLSDMHLLADLANGSNCVLAKDVLKRTNANVDYINDKFNGTNINNKCGSTHLEMLQSKIKEGNYDLGFAFDGDADRVLLVDAKGNVIDGDHIMYLLACYLKDINKLKDDTLVTTVMSNIGLFKALENKKIKTEVTSVGDRNVLDCMLKNGYVIGGEQSGHIICSLDSRFGDGLKTILLVLTALKYKHQNIIEACADLKIYPQLLINEKVIDKTIVLNDEDIKNKIAEIGERLGNEGRILVRPSGTEPLIRVMVEAQNTETCQTEVMSVINLIRDKGYAKS